MLELAHIFEEGAMIPEFANMTILLDIDGVLVTTPAWKPTEQDTDGFMKFNQKAARNLARIVDETQASIVLTTTHRINYSLERWKELLHSRGINPIAISKINDISTLGDMTDRATEIKEWVDKSGKNQKYVVIDDDLSINGLPVAIRNKCVLTKSMIGLDDETTQQVLNILQDT